MFEGSIHMIGQFYGERESNVLWQIREGIPVYDWDSQHVGDVNYVQFPGELAEEDNELGEYLMHMPEDIRDLLLREGFVQVEGGLVWPDYYVRPGQILEVDDKGIRLNVMKAEIMRF